MPTALYLQSKPSKITSVNWVLLKGHHGGTIKHFQKAMQIKD
jgi:hypothetical protein